MTTPEGDSFEAKYNRIIKNDTIVKDIYLDGGIFRLAKRRFQDNYKLTERWWFYPDGQMMDYKCYENDELILYSRYNKEGQVLKIDGCPILYLDTVPTMRLVEKNIDLVRELDIINPPRTILHLWIDGDANRPAEEQITQDLDSLQECKIEDNSTGYIFEINDTLQRDIPVLWSINDSLSNKILISGKIIDRFKGK